MTARRVASTMQGRLTKYEGNMVQRRITQAYGRDGVGVALIGSVVLAVASALCVVAVPRVLQLLHSLSIPGFTLL